MDSILGQDQSLQKLLQAYQKDHLPHAVLFIGPDSVGKKKTALAIAQLLTCESEEKPCGLCGSCLRVEKKQSENLLFIEPTGLNIKIDQSRSIYDFLSLANFDKNRVVIIDQAHALTAQAANALLKILEEPSDHVYFILISNEETLVLPTIRSRCQTMRFNPLSVADLRRIHPGQPDWVYLNARGQIDRLNKLSDKDGEQKRTDSFELLNGFLFNADFLLWTGWRDLLKDREFVIQNFENWILICRDALVKQNNSELIFNKDQVSLISLIEKIDHSKIEHLIMDFMKAIHDVRGYCDAVLVMESLWVRHISKNEALHA